MLNMKTLKTDILILGSGGAGLFAALHAHQHNPGLSITVAVKGLLGKCGCTRMVQGGYNVALAKDDSVERHFMDTIVGGKWLPRQDLALSVTLPPEDLDSALAVSRAVTDLWENFVKLSRKAPAIRV